MYEKSKKMQILKVIILSVLFATSANAHPHSNIFHELINHEKSSNLFYVLFFLLITLLIIRKKIKYEKKS